MDEIEMDGSYGGGHGDEGGSDGSEHDPSVGYDSSIGSGGDGGRSGGVDHMDQDMIQLKEDMDQELDQEEIHIQYDIIGGSYGDPYNIYTHIAQR